MSRTRIVSILHTGALLTGLALAPLASGQTNTISGAIGVDNYFAVYSGTLTGASTLHASGNGPAVSATPINITTPNPVLYIAAWSDNGVQQGFMADLTINGMRVKTGDPVFLVYATGDDRDILAQTPTIAEMTAQLALANTASGAAATSSVGWQLPAVGGQNNGTFPSSNPWGQQLGVGPDVRWIWFDSGEQLAGPDVPFSGGFNHREHLIFRVVMCPGNPCDGDLNGDGVVNAADLAILLGTWGMCPPVGGGGPNPN